MSSRPRKIPKHRVKHGTYNGFQWHYYWKNEVCAPCRQAKRDHDKKIAKKRKAQIEYLRKLAPPDSAFHQMSAKEQHEVRKDMKDQGLL